MCCMMPAEFVQQIVAWIFLKSFTHVFVEITFTLDLCFFLFVCFRQNQVVLLETLEQEISKFKECNSIVDINALVSTSNAF